MGITLAVCQRSTPGLGRDMDQTYANVVVGVQSSGAEWSAVENHPVWSDPNGNEFAVQLTDAQYSVFMSEQGLTHSGMPCQPKWQVRDDTNGQTTPAFGSFDDATDSTSPFRQDVELEDTRYRIRFYDANPLTDGVEVVEESVAASATPLTRYLRIFETDGSPANITQSNALIVLGGRQLVLNLVAGIASFDIAIEKAKTVMLVGDHKYRVSPSIGGDRALWRIFSRTIED